MFTLLGVGLSLVLPCSFNHYLSPQALAQSARDYSPVSDPISLWPDQGVNPHKCNPKYISNEDLINLWPDPFNLNKLSSHSRDPQKWDPITFLSEEGFLARK